MAWKSAFAFDMHASNFLFLSPCKSVSLLVPCIGTALDALFGPSTQLNAECPPGFGSNHVSFRDDSTDSIAQGESTC